MITVSSITWFYAFLSPDVWMTHAMFGFPAMSRCRSYHWFVPTGVAVMICALSLAVVAVALLQSHASQYSAPPRMGVPVGTPDMGFTFSLPGVVDAVYLAKVESFGHQGWHAIVFGESDALSKLSLHRESIARHAKLMLAKRPRHKNDAVLTASIISVLDNELTVSTINLMTGQIVDYDVQAALAGAMVYDQCNALPANHSPLTLHLAERTNLQATFLNDWGSYWLVRAVVDAPRASRLRQEIKVAFATIADHD